jgi:adenylate cyclase
MAAVAESPPAIGTAEATLERTPPGLPFRLQRAFARDQAEGLMLAAKVRIIAVTPILAWLLSNELPTPAEYWWQFASGAVFVPTSVLHYLAARHGGQRFRAVYAMFAVDLAILGVFFAYPNPFSVPPISAATSFNAAPFFWFLFFLIHASFSGNWRLVVWTGGWIMLVRGVQAVWVIGQPGTVTEADVSIATVADWLQAISNPDFVLVAGCIGELVGAASFTIATAFLVWRSHRILRRQVIAERARAQIARYVSTAVVDEVMAEGGRFVSARQAEVGVLFVDVVGFTRLAEKMTPDQTIRFLRQLHTRLAEAVFARGGAIDKFLGDGLMASFGVTAPAEHPGPTAAAETLAAGLEMVRTVEDWNTERARRGEPPVVIGVGIDYGVATVGDVGDERRLEFTVVGDIVNVASRVEELTRELETPLLATERALAAARSTADGAALADTFIPLGPQRIRGRSNPVAVFGRGA